MIEFKTSTKNSVDFFEFTTRSGMKIKLAEPDVMETLRFANVLTYKRNEEGESLDEFGNILSSTYLGGMHAFLAVKEIDGFPQAPITTKLMLETLQKQLGNENSIEVMSAYMEMRASKSGQESIAEAKK